VVFVVLAIVFAVQTPVPDILVSADGRTFAVRGTVLSTTAARTRSRCANGSPPTPMGAT
jgi:hypothetical protein